ncbi:TRAP transporter permease [Natrinema longum]|uniref:TRAP transporter fused permease subunit n=1 Tax=Natrinema longum TaxID=370324 RepID=A0A8A2UD57_9EURY|nr:TRAP transporter fused permease subunit [Natrinema longum]MBZ6495270.1 TRAP transporter fused permease subunit [Natrinema longum]QSW86751.1 TRAP transporter fused permease subunit [Natrinema longum]
MSETYSERGVSESALGLIVYVFGFSLTLYTVGYAVSLVGGWPLSGLVPEPGWVKRDELYMIIFFGGGIALYYLDYARQEFVGESADVSIDAAASSTADESTEGALERARSVWGRIDPYVALALALVSLLAMAYVYTNFTRLEGDAYILGYTTTDHLVGIVLITLAIDTTRRAFGTVIAAVAVAAIAYAHSAVGPRLFGVFEHSGQGWEQIAENGAIGISGVYDGTLMGIGSTWVAIFIMFAGIAKAFGLMEFVREVGTELGTSLRTGVVQIAVISSMIMGSITGSAAANTATTGSFTIPMIKDQGVRDDVAASIEAVASAGGQMLPPVMGVAAFLMADIIQVPYLDIVQAGVIPAALFYFSVCLAVHFTILKFGWISNDLSPFRWRLLLKGLHFAVPMGVLLYTLVYLRYTPLSAGMNTIVAIIGVMFVRNLVVGVVGIGSDEVTAEVLGREVRGDNLLGNLGATAKQTADGFKQGGIDMAPLVGVLAAMGVIVELLEGTGLTARVATSIVSLGDVSLLGLGGGLFVVLFLAMIASILFGLGMPTPAAYILVAILVAKPITELGTPDIATHMFVFYFAMLSAITPPVAISVAIGARIAGASFLQSAKQALRLGAPGFVIPYAFIANESLIYWSTETLVAFPVVLAGTVALIVATIGFDGARDLSAPVRAAFIVAALGAMFGSIVHVAIQLVAAAAIVAALLHARFVVGYELPSGSAAGSDIDAPLD